MPAQEGPRADNQAELAEMTTGQQPGQRGQDRPVGPGQLRCLDLALECSDLVPQDQNLRVYDAVGPGEQGKPAEHSQHRQVGESY